MSVVHILLRMLTLARMQQENEERMPNPLKKLAIVIAGHMGAAEAALSHLHGVLRVLAREHRRCQLLLDYSRAAQTAVGGVPPGTSLSRVCRSDRGVEPTEA